VVRVARRQPQANPAPPHAHGRHDHIAPASSHFAFPASPKKTPLPANPRPPVSPPLRPGVLVGDLDSRDASRSGRADAERVRVLAMLHSSPLAGSAQGLHAMRGSTCGRRAVSRRATRVNPLLGSRCSLARAQSAVRALPATTKRDLGAPARRASSSSRAPSASRFGRSPRSLGRPLEGSAQTATSRPSASPASDHPAFPSSPTRTRLPGPAARRYVVAARAEQTTLESPSPNSPRSRTPSPPTDRRSAPPRSPLTMRPFFSPIAGDSRAHSRGATTSAAELNQA